MFADLEKQRSGFAGPSQSGKRIRSFGTERQALILAPTREIAMQAGSTPCGAVPGILQGLSLLQLHGAEKMKPRAHEWIMFEEAAQGTGMKDCRRGCLLVP